MHRYATRIASASFVFAAWGSGAFGAEPTTASAADAKALATPDHAIVWPRADPATPHELIYPPIAIWGAQEGTVQVELLVGPDGWVQDARILLLSGYMQLDAAALVTVGYWHYLPATKDGVPTAALHRTALQFKLTGVGVKRWQDRRPPPLPLNSDGSPTPDTDHFLLYPQMARHRASKGDVTMNILVRSEGNISDALIVRSSGNSQLDSAALISAGYWQYDPAILAGSATDAWKTVIVHFVPKDTGPQSPADEFAPSLPRIPGMPDNGTSIMSEPDTASEGK